MSDYDPPIKLTRTDLFLMTVVLNEFNKLMPDELKQGKTIENEDLTLTFEKTNELLEKLANALDYLDKTKEDTLLCADATSYNNAIALGVVDILDDLRANDIKTTQDFTKWYKERAKNEH